MNLLADITAAGKPQPFVLTTLGGREVYIRQMTARQVAQWWVWVFEKPGKTYDQRLIELFKRLACDADGADLVSNDDAVKLRELPGAAAMLCEFYTEAKRRNFLYQTAEEENAERDRFFTKASPAAIGLNTSSAGSPSPAVSATTSDLPTA